ncbi:MAG: hypothetical protein HYV63_11990, partial [Candidatus Schekmanbacteria bacterium]|nr:hypothetical protein [Candidatus Schekmanbacteria bacterium]
IRQAQEKVCFQGLPARICWLGQGERARMGELINHEVAVGRIKAPIVTGGVAAVAAFAMAVRWLEWGTEMAAVVACGAFVVGFAAAGLISSGSLRDFRAVLRSG